MNKKNITVCPFNKDLMDDYFDFHEKRTDGSSGFVCYCTMWNMTEEEINKTVFGKNEFELRANTRKAAEKLINEDKLHGYLAYIGNTVVGWCNSGGRDSYEFLGRHVKTSGIIPLGKVKSIACIEVSKAHRRMGIAQALLDYICAEAKKENYDMVEAYPNIYSIAELENYEKYLSLYEKTGFETVFKNETGSIVQKKL